VDSRRARSTSGPHGQHSLKQSLAAQLVSAAHVAPHDIVLEIGAGTGTLTRRLAMGSRKVVAVELDPRLATRLRADFCGWDNVVVVEGDILTLPFPRAPFRAFGNIPFHTTTALLRRVLAESSRMTRADLIVQWEVARKRTADRPTNLLNLLWGPWWSFSISRRLPAECFRPRPQVDAAMLCVIRRERPLIPRAERRRYEAAVRRAFSRPTVPLRRQLSAFVTPRQLNRIAQDLGFARDARAIDLNVHQWAGLFNRMTALCGSPKRPRRS
jgi:23S rRNA (adenine-N6)-dimethyltransferase